MLKRKGAFLALLFLTVFGLLTGRPQTASAVAGSSYFQCLGVVTAEMSGLLAAGAAVPSAITGSVTAALNLNLQSYVLALGSEICAQGSNVVTGLASISALLSSDLHNQARQEDASLTHKFLLEERLRTERDFGSGAAVSNVCSRGLESQAVGGVISGAAQTSQTSDSVANAWMQQKIPKTSALAKIASQPTENFDATNLFGTNDLAGGSTLSTQQTAAAQNFVLNVTNPVPYVASSQAATNTSEGQRQAVANLRNHAILSLARHALNEQMALRTAQGNSSLVAWQNSLAKSAGLPPLPAGTTGVSLMSALGTDVASRWSNPVWLQDLHTMSSTGVLRETALEEALALEIDWQSLLSEQRSEALLAAIAAKQVGIRRAP